MDKLLPCPFCGADGKMVSVDSRSWWVECRGCEVEGRSQHFENDAIDAWNRRAANAAPDPALLALAKFGAMVLDWSPLECGFPTIPGGVIDDMAVRSGCALEDASDGGHECWTAPDVRLAIAALLAPDAPDGADGAGEVTP